MNRGERVYNWIMDRLDEGMTVYASNYLKRIKITAKHREAVRYHNGHCEIARGRNWDSINLCRIEAIDE